MNGYLVMLNVEDGQVPLKLCQGQEEAFGLARTAQANDEAEGRGGWPEAMAAKWVWYSGDEHYSNMVVEFRDGVPTDIWYFARKGDQGDFALSGFRGRRGTEYARLAPDEMTQFARALGTALDLRQEGGKQVWTCKHDHAATRRILGQMGWPEKFIDAAVEEFKAAGGYCDCEIMLNVVCAGAEGGAAAPAATA